MKQALLPCGTLILVLVSICVRGSSALSNRKLLDSAGHLVDELNELRQRLVATTGFSQPQWARKLQQDYNPYPAGSYYGGYGYGYYYGGYYAGEGGAGHEYTMMRRRSLLSTAGSAGHVRQLQQAYPYPYGYGGYYGYGYYYGAYPPAADSYAMMEMSAGRRRMMGSVEDLAEMLTDETDGFVDPDTIQMEDSRRNLKAMTYDWPSANYGYSYGYGYYYGGYGGYANPYTW